MQHTTAQWLNTIRNIAIEKLAVEIPADFSMIDDVILEMMVSLLVTL